MKRFTGGNYKLLEELCIQLIGSFKNINLSAIITICII